MEYDEELDGIDLDSSSRKQLQQLQSSNAYSGPPDLLLYEQREMDAKNRALWAGYKLRNGMTQESEPFYEGRNVARTWRLLRFFRSLEGFLKGELDLTGRHLPRWNMLHKSFKDYLVDFLELWPTLELVITREPMRLEPEMYFETKSYKVLDEDLWKSVMNRWRLTEYHGYIAIDGMKHALKKYTEAKGIPRIQKLWLLHLANELLYAIFSQTQFDSARMLSLTCKALNAIGRQYIFHRRTFTFEYSYTKVDHNLPLAPQYTKLAQIAKVKLTDSAGFFFSRPDLCQKVDNLSLSNEWGGSLFVKDEDFSLDDVESGFMARISETFTEAVSLSAHLTTLSLFRNCLDSDMLRAICSLQSLNVLEAKFCDLPVETREPLLASSFTNSHLTNLKIMMEASFDDGSWDVWYILVLFSNLRTLDVHGLGENPLPMALETLWTHWTFMDTLERLCIEPLCSHDVVGLASWIRGELVGGLPRPLRLTHFKLIVNYFLWDVWTAQIIRALQTAPLQVLVLEGIHRDSAYPRLIEDIAIQFPDLIGLTLVMRDSDRQTQNKPATWPCSSWEYAPSLARFNHLEHFGWNFLINEDDVSTRTLLLFENGFIADDDWERAREEDTAMGYDRDDHCAVLPFATACSTLNSFGLLKGNHFSLYQITREVNGPVNIEWEFCWGSKVIQRWVPDPFVGGWPYIKDDCRKGG